MRMLCRFCLSLLFVTLLCSCNFRPLSEMNNTHYVRVYIDEHIMNTTEGFYRDDIVRPSYRRPEVMRVVLADDAGGNVVAEKYLRNQGDDEQGHYYDGYIICDPGEWNLMAWNFDTQSTRVDDASDVRSAKAFTNTIASHLYGSLSSRLNAKGEEQYADERIVYEPDHLFVAEYPSVRVSHSGQIDTLRTSDGQYFKASTIVESWYIQVNVEGVSRLSSAVSLLDGLGGSKKLISSELDENDPVTLYFEMAPALRTKTDEDTGVVYATFCSFGKLPGRENNLDITFDLVTSWGKSLSATFDISEEFGSQVAGEHHWIILDKTIIIPEKPDGDTGGGFSPGVDDWNDVNTDLII